MDGRPPGNSGCCSLFCPRVGVQWRSRGALTVVAFESSAAVKEQCGQGGTGVSQRCVGAGALSGAREKLGSGSLGWHSGLRAGADVKCDTGVWAVVDLKVYPLCVGSESPVLSQWRWAVGMLEGYVAMWAVDALCCHVG